MRPDEHIAWRARDAAQIDLDLVTGHLSNRRLARVLLDRCPGRVSGVTCPGAAEGGS